MRQRESMSKKPRVMIFNKSKKVKRNQSFLIGILQATIQNSKSLSVRLSKNSIKSLDIALYSKKENSLITIPQMNGFKSNRPNTTLQNMLISIKQNSILTWEWIMKQLKRLSKQKKKEPWQTKYTLLTSIARSQMQRLKKIWK